MTTDKYSRASKRRWAKVPEKEKFDRMSQVSKAGWDKLDEKARRRRAKKGRRTRKLKEEQNKLHESTN